MTKTNPLKPMSLGLSLLFFGVPAAASTFGIYVVMQRLHAANVPLLLNYFLSFVSLMALMLLAALVAYRIEGNAPSWGAFKERFRLRPMRGVDWLWTLGLSVFQMVAYLGLAFTSLWLIRLSFFAPPAFLPPELDPRLQVGLNWVEFLDIPLKGNGWLILPFFGVMLFNVFGEEFWWRGVIFPRQELAFGKWTWAVHGVLWTLFHVFFRWRWLMILPGALAVSYVVQHTRNTWPAVISHALLMGLALIPMSIGILGAAP